MPSLTHGPQQFGELENPDARLEATVSHLAAFPPPLEDGLHLSVD
jgi:hypothetical protein